MQVSSEIIGIVGYPVLSAEPVSLAELTRYGAVLDGRLRESPSSNIGISLKLSNTYTF